MGADDPGVVDPGLNGLDAVGVRSAIKGISGTGCAHLVAHSGRARN